MARDARVARLLPGVLASKETTMPDDTGDRSRQDQLQINVHEPHEIRYWTKRLGCSEQELRAAVARAGVMAEDVRAALGRG